MNLTSVGTSRCDVPARESAGGIVAPLNAARTAQRAVPTRFRGSMREIFRGNLSMNRNVAQAFQPAGWGDFSVARTNERVGVRADVSSDLILGAEAREQNGGTSHSIQTFRKGDTHA